MNRTWRLDGEWRLVTGSSCRMVENSGPMSTRRLSSGRSWQQAERQPRNRYAQTGKGARQLGRPGKKSLPKTATDGNLGATPALAEGEKPRNGIKTLGKPRIFTEEVGNTGGNFYSKCHGAHTNPLQINLVFAPLAGVWRQPSCAIILRP